MESLILGGLGLVLVLALPGALIFRIAHPRGRGAELVGLAPVLSLGAIFVLGEFGRLLRVPFGSAAFFSMIVALGAALFFRRTRSGPEVSPESTDPVRSQLLPWLMLGAGIVIGLVTWMTALRGVAVVPPNEDSTYHGFITARIANLSTTDPEVVMVSDLGPGGRATAFYPVGIHGPAALMHRITGISIADALTAEAVVFAAVVFPIGIFLLSRYLAPDRPLVAGFASLLVPALAMFPYKPIHWGGIALIVGMSIVPVVLTQVGRTIFSNWSPPDLILAALALAAVFVTHPSEIALMALLVGALAFERLRGHWTAENLRRSAARSAAIALVALVILAPVLPQIPGGVTEREALDDKPELSFDEALGPILTLSAAVDEPQGLLALLAGAGIFIAILKRKHRGWLLAAGLSVTLYLLAATSKSGFSQLLTFPWYRQSERLAYNAALFVPFFGGLFLSSLAESASRLFNPKRMLGIGAILVVVVGAVVSVNLPAGRFIHDFQRTGFGKLSPVGSQELAAFSYIASRVRPGERVLNDLNADGSLWMYAFTEVSPVFLLPNSSNFSDQSWKERIYLIDHIHEMAVNQRVRQLIESYRVALVYFDETGFPLAGRHMDLARLRGTPGLREILQSGDAHVFEVQPRE